MEVKYSMLIRLFVYLIVLEQECDIKNNTNKGNKNKDKNDHLRVLFSVLQI